MAGKVYIVGAGPGAPDLLTVRAARLLEAAEAVFYDDLVGPEILGLCHGRLEYVGKRRERHSRTQAEINDLLLAAAREGRTVVRLKGGDPFVFGRGGEELRFLVRQGVFVEVVPGVTASMGAAAVLGIPLTMRSTSKSLHFLAAHHADTEPLEVPREGTLVFYMGAKKLKHVARAVLEARWNPATPVALVRNATLENQEIRVCRLDEVESLQPESPLVVIIGEVVGFYGGKSG